MQHLARLDCYPYRIPFRAPFATAHGLLTAREGAIIELLTGDGLAGLGEIAPLPAFAGSDLATALAPLPDLLTRLSGRSLAEVLDLLYVEAGMLPAATVCGLESALLDALGRERGQSLGALLSGGGQLRRMVAVNAVIGVQSIEETVVSVQAALAAGYSCLKLKLDCQKTESEPARIAAVRAACGAGPRLRLDANEGLEFEQAVELLKRCAVSEIEYIEQPLPAADLAGMGRLRRAQPIRLAADEALSDLESARRVLDAEAADVLIIKPQLVGGLRAARQLLTEANRRGVQCVITSALESGIGIVGALQLVAASPEIELACGLATLALLEDDLLTVAPSLEEGALTVPRGFGLGVELDRGALKRYRAR